MSGERIDHQLQIAAASQEKKQETVKKEEIKKKEPDNPTGWILFHSLKFI